MMRKEGLKICIATMLMCCSSYHVYAGAFANEDLTPAGAGVANAVVASADDLSAAIYNPAGLAWQQGVQTMVGNQSRYRNINANVAGVSHEGDAVLGGVNLFAISWMPHGSKWGVASSMVTPYTTRTNWAAAFPGQLEETKMDLQRFAVDTFWRVNNTLGIAAGLDVYDASVLLNTNNNTFSGSAVSDVGAHASLRWAFQPLWSLGFHMRQGVDVTLENNTGSALNMNLPDEFTLGVSHDLMDDEMRIELDIKHSKWSSFSDMNVVNNGIVSQSIVANLSDTTDISLGATWFWRHNTQLRLGYAYEQGASQINGFQPVLADQTGHRLSVGFGGMMAGMHVDMAYAGVLYPDVDASGAYAGTYSDARQSLMFSLSKKF